MNRITIACRSLLFLLLFPAAGFAQTVNYDDVAVIVNDSSATSVAIGNYFANARNIPTSRIIHLAVPPRETIDSLEFVALQGQLKIALTSNNLADSLNYLVTTKGMPLRISVNGACDSTINSNPIPVSNCTCLESQISMLLGPLSGQILSGGASFNPARGWNQPFDRDSLGIFAVTRLDAYTEQEVRDLIDRSGPDLVYNTQAQAVLDYSNALTSDLTLWESWVERTVDSLTPLPLLVLDDTANATFVANEANVVSYFGIHYQPSIVQTNFNWAPGGFGMLYYGKLAESFDPANNLNNEYWSGDMIRDGATVSAAPVYWTYVSPAPRPWEMFTQYLDPATNFNAAEAFYNSVVFLGDQWLLVGDPKTSVRSALTLNTPPAPPEDLPFIIFPNPNAGQFTLQADLKPGPVTISIANPLGQLVYREAIQHAGGTWTQSLDLNQVSRGVYLLRVDTERERIVRRVVIDH